MDHRLRLGCGLAVLLISLSCGSSGSSSPTGPSTVTSGSTISQFISGVSTTAGQTASQQNGSLPPAGDGPTATVSSSSALVPGAADIVQITANSGFDTVNIAVGSNDFAASFNSARLSPLSSGVAASGFWQVKLSAPTTAVSIVYDLSSSIPITSNGAFDVLVQVIAPSGAAGPIAIRQVTRSSSPPGTEFSGAFSAQFAIMTTTTGANGRTVTCESDRVVVGTMSVFLVQSGGSLSGSFEQTTGSETEVGGTGGPLCAPLPTATAPFVWSGLPISGTSSNITFSGQTISNPVMTGGTVVITDSFSFAGGLSGGTISGTISYGEAGAGPGSAPGSTVSGGGSVTIPVTLH